VVASIRSRNPSYFTHRQRAGTLRRMLCSLPAADPRSVGRFTYAKPDQTMNCAKATDDRHCRRGIEHRAKRSFIAPCRPRFSSTASARRQVCAA